MANPEEPAPPEGRFKSEDFRTRREEWNEYLLPETNIVVRVKTVATTIQRQVDAMGKQVNGPDGQPVIRVSHQILVTAHYSEETFDA
ncbi:MAG: hypothetical protein OXP70_04160 [Acidobacteriota bacterium]|nr:hypothetical protein [Acidobacteriota bacterium]